MIIGVIVLITQFAIYGGLAIAAGGARNFLLTSPRATILTGRAAGVLFIAIGALTAWQGWSHR